MRPFLLTEHERDLLAALRAIPQSQREIVEALIHELSAGEQSPPADFQSVVIPLQR